MTAISRFFAVSSAWNHGEATQDGATATFCLSTWFCPNWGLQQKIAIKVGKTMLSSSAFWGSLNMLKEIPITLFGRLPSFLLELCFFCCLGPYTPVLPTSLSTQCLRGHNGGLRGSSL